MNSQWYSTEGLSNNTYGDSKSSQKEQSKSSSKQYPENDACAVTYDKIMYTSGYFKRYQNPKDVVARELFVCQTEWLVFNDWLYLLKSRKKLQNYNSNTFSNYISWKYNTSEGTRITLIAAIP